MEIDSVRVLFYGTRASASLRQYFRRHRCLAFEQENSNLCDLRLIHDYLRDTRKLDYEWFYLSFL